MNDENFNREQAWQLYALFCGDAERTAHALNIRPEDVVRVATECGWDKKLAAIIALKKSASPGDVERAINRALTFTQAHRCRLFLDRLLLRLSQLDNAEIEAYFFTGRSSKMEFNPKAFSSRAVADLASAIEKCSAVAAQALCDTAQDRAARDETGESGDSSGALHAKIALAMAAVGADNSPAALLLDAQLATAQQLAPPMKVIESPNDSDDH